MSEPSWRRNILSHTQRFRDHYRYTSSSGKTIVIEQDEGTASCVWDASIVLAKFIEKFPPGHWKNKRIIEIGSGCGLSGIVAAMLGAETVLSDLGEVVPVLKKNFEANVAPHQINDFNNTQQNTTHNNNDADNVDVHPHSRVVELSWGEDVSQLQPPFDYILGADVVYEIQHFDLLLKCLVSLAGPATLVYLSIEHRWQDVEKWFWEDIGKYFTYQPVKRDMLDAEFSHPKIDVYELRLKPQFLWPSK